MRGGGVPRLQALSPGAAGRSDARARGGKPLAQCLKIGAGGHQAHLSVGQGEGDCPGAGGVRGEKLHHRRLAGKADGAASFSVAVGQEGHHSVAGIALGGREGDLRREDDTAEAEREGEEGMGHGIGLSGLGPDQAGGRALK